MRRCNRHRMTARRRVYAGYRLWRRQLRQRLLRSERRLDRHHQLRRGRVPSHLKLCQINIIAGCLVVSYTLLDSGPDNQPSITCRCCDKDTSCILKTPALRHTLELLFCGYNMCRICTLSCTKDLVAFLELGCLASRERSRRFQHDAREL